MTDEYADIIEFLKSEETDVHDFEDIPAVSGVLMNAICPGFFYMFMCLCLLNATDDSYCSVVTL